MGCQNSQIAQNVAQEPNQLPPENSPQLQKPNQDASKPTPNNQKNLHDKENSQPAQQIPSKRQVKERALSRKSTELKKKNVKSECNLQEAPVMAETTNLPKENLVLGENKAVASKRNSQQLSARQIVKPEQVPVGPSSKTIEPPAEPENKTGVESFPISNVLEQKKKEEVLEVKNEQQEIVEQPAKIIENKEQKVEQKEKQKQPERRVSTPEDERVSFTQFSLDQFDKTQKGKQIQEQQVALYLNELMTFETQVMNALIDRLEQRERRRYEEVAC